MRLKLNTARARFVDARVARLATVGADGRPHIVPVTFAVDGDVIVFAIDHKPKSTTDLRRLIRGSAPNWPSGWARSIRSIGSGRPAAWWSVPT